MKKFYQQYSDLHSEVIKSIQKHVTKHGNIYIDSIDPNLCFNIGISHYLIHIEFNYLIDNYGYRHDFTELSLEQLCQIADKLK